MIIDDFGGRPPNRDLVKKTRKMKPTLLRIISSIENQTSLSYPELHIYYAMILDPEDTSIVRGLITNQKDSKTGSVRQVVYLSAFTLDYLPEKITTGVLVEEFLHYVYRMKMVIVEQSFGGKPDKEEMEPIDQWFSAPYFKKCFDLVQLPAKAREAKPLIAEWGEKKYPVVDRTDIPSMSGQHEFEVPGKVFEALLKRGRLPEPQG